MTLTELKYVIAVARERHFGRAAESCFVSQPSLSVAIKKLEDDREDAREDYQELLTDFIADATRKLAEIGGEIPTPSLPTSAHARVAETTVEATGRVMTSPAQAPINVDGTAAYAMPQTGAVSVAPATPTPSRVEKDLSGFGDADDAFEFEEID